MANASWKYIGCSAHSVPSLSKVAIRSAGGTNSGDPGLVDRGDEVDDGLLRLAGVPRRQRIRGLGGDGGPRQRAEKRWGDKAMQVNESS